jgi:hypothetical protein
MQTALQTVSAFLATIRNAAEQFTYPQKWIFILSRIFRNFLKDPPLKHPLPIPRPACSSALTAVVRFIYVKKLAMPCPE